MFLFSCVICILLKAIIILFYFVKVKLIISVSTKWFAVTSGDKGTKKITFEVGIVGFKAIFG